MIAPRVAPRRTDQYRVAPTATASHRRSDTPVAAVCGLKDGLLAEIRGAKGFFYNTVVAQAQKIEVTDDRVTFTFLPAHRALREQFEQIAPVARAAAERLAGAGCRRRRFRLLHCTASPSEPGDRRRPPPADGSRSAI